MKRDEPMPTIPTSKPTIQLNIFTIKYKNRTKRDGREWMTVLLFSTVSLFFFFFCFFFRKSIIMRNSIEIADVLLLEHWPPCQHSLWHCEYTFQTSFWFSAPFLSIVAEIGTNFVNLTTDKLNKNVRQAARLFLFLKNTRKEIKKKWKLLKSEQE